MLPILSDLLRHPELWNADESRRKVAGAVAQSDTILVRYPRLDDGEDYGAAIETPWRSEAAAWLPSIRAPIQRLMTAVGGYSLQRVLISRLSPGGVIAAHRDADMAYTDQLDIARYHLVVEGLPGSMFHCGTETVQMLTGEVWTFDARQEHSCVNDSSGDRTHLIVDMLLWG